jgi:aminobenzoyl-glutamate utilization protein B|tara:strand:- start:133 stop:1548 length:1416 start_codon:yes stop_codon:yes gene_type:complete
MRYFLFLITGISPFFIHGQSDYILLDLDSSKGEYSKMAMQIWEYAEMGYQEVKSSALLQNKLNEAGFTIQAGVAGIPTAFIAEYNNGGPVIAILGEYDALPGLSQKALPYKVTNEGRGGHACGHHLFGTASAAAAISLKKYIKKYQVKGTIRYYGCPAEEGGSGKVYMTRAGLFDDVDVALHWHADDENSANPRPALANKSAKFRFYGRSAHAAGAPQEGRSALDAVEVMNYMTNLMREHMDSSARIHYVITHGGEAPNVVPDFAEVYYYSRHPKRDKVMALFDRIVKTAEAAALGTGTKMEYEMIGGTHDLLHVPTLQRMVHRNFTKIGGFKYDDQEIEFAKKIASTLEKPLDMKYIHNVAPYEVDPQGIGGSTDVGDVSYTVPTAGLRGATWVPGTPAHSWQAVAAGGTTIGLKGMMQAAKALTLSGIELLEKNEIIRKIKEEFDEIRGKDFNYVPLLGDREPALDYRN